MLPLHDGQPHQSCQRRDDGFMNESGIPRPYMFSLFPFAGYSRFLPGSCQVLCFAAALRPWTCGQLGHTARIVPGYSANRQRKLKNRHVHDD